MSLTIAPPSTRCVRCVVCVCVLFWMVTHLHGPQKSQCARVLASSNWLVVRRVARPCPPEHLSRSLLPPGHTHVGLLFVLQVIDWLSELYEELRAGVHGAEADASTEKQNQARYNSGRLWARLWARLCLQEGSRRSCFSERWTYDV
jgi:hypothetical protein